jgi:hypothetical protein
LSSAALEKLPAQNTGGLYKTSARMDGFVEAGPSRVFRDGPGIFASEEVHSTRGDPSEK